MNLLEKLDLFNILIHMLLLFTAIPVHECAHALMADKLGDPTPRSQGRITLNPFAHLTLWGSMLLIFAGFGWGKPVAVDARNFKKPKRDMALTALAGPVSNIIMAYLSMVVYKLLISDALYGGIRSLLPGSAQFVPMIFAYSAIINISLAVFNFLPVPPLDGSKIFNSVLPDSLYFRIMKYEQYIIVVVIILVYSGLLDTPLGFLNGIVRSALMSLTGWVDGIAPVSDMYLLDMEYTMNAR